LIWLFSILQTVCLDWPWIVNLLGLQAWATGMRVSKSLYTIYTSSTENDGKMKYVVESIKKNFADNLKW
jgi:hypothetical protein